MNEPKNTTKSAAHAPGPWLFRRGNEVFTVETTTPSGVVPNIVAYVVFSDGGTNEEFETQHANACLNAAAPTKLGALKRALNPLGHTDASWEIRELGHTTCTKSCERIRAAIKAATGEELP